jgi:DNA-binding MarR family transcriptional regulator
MGALLRVAWQWVRDDVYSQVVQTGYEDLSAAQIHAFRYPSLDGMRPSELAARIQTSKQSVNDLLGHLERHGYCIREPDPVDQRGRIVRLTVKGRQLEKAVDDAARSAELKIGELLGAGRARELRGMLEELSCGLGGFDQRPSP